MRLIPAVGLLLVIGSPAVAQPQPKPKANESAQVFGFTNVWQLHLELTAKEFAALEPGAVMFPGFGQPKAPNPKPKDPSLEIHKGGSFGIEFPWGHADLTVDGRTYKNIGVRYKGGGSYLASMGKLRRNLKVDLDHYDPKLRFHKFKTLNLNAGGADPTRVREALTYAAYRNAGVPAPRTAFAELTLTVPGKYDKELVGTYTVVEEIDKAFLKDRFKKDNGLLLKPEVRFGNMRGPLSYQGDTWEPYKDALKPKREPTRDEAERVIGFVKLVDRGTDEQFRAEIGNYLDVDAFLRFLAVTALTVNLDSFFTGGHNAYIYLRPDTNKIVFIPWDVDLSFGGFFLFGQPDTQADVSLTHPYPGENKLVDRMMAAPGMRDRYMAVVKELTATAFSKDKLTTDLAAVEKVTKEPLAREAKAASNRKEATGMPFGFPGAQPANPPDLRTWIDKRLASATAQVEGKSQGTIPAGFQFGQAGARPPRPGDVMPNPIRDNLRLTPEQRRKMDELQRETDRRIEEVLTEEQRSQWKRLREAGPPKGPPGKGPG